MKKLLLLSALALGALTMNAQQISVTVGGQPVANGGVVDNYNITEIKEDGFYMLQLDPQVFVTSSESGKYAITVSNVTAYVNEEFRQTYKANNYNTDPYGIQFCWPLQCMTPVPGESAPQNGELQAGTATNLRIDSNYLYEQPYDGFTLSCVVNIIPDANPSNNFSFTLNMIYDYEHALVGSVVVDDATPEYYNLNGVKIANPDKGIYIVKKGGKTSKVVF